VTPLGFVDPSPLGFPKEPAGGDEVNQWMRPKVTDYWDQNVGAIDAASRRLELLDDSTRSSELKAIAAAVAEHVRVLPNDLIPQAAAVIADDLYKAACTTDRWDSNVEKYLDASAGTLAAELAGRGFRIQYLVDNAWEDLTRPVDLFEGWFRASGFAYACPQVLALQLARRDGAPAEHGLEELSPNYISEARHLAASITADCHSSEIHLFGLETDWTDDSFSTAFRYRGEPGVITLFRNEAPEPGTKIAMW
jgi:hypothetical protein